MYAVDIKHSPNLPVSTNSKQLNDEFPRRRNTIEQTDIKVSLFTHTKI